MIDHELREFVDRVMDAHAIHDQDVRMLENDILSDVVMTRDIVDVLVALERAVPETCAMFGDYLVALVVDFAVWQSRPTGFVGRDTAHWLVTTLSAGEGPTPVAQRIAGEIVREAEACDEVLLGFALRKGAAGQAFPAVERVVLAS